MIAPLLAILMRRELRRAFRRVVWIGPVPDDDLTRPLVVYSNHQYHHDGYLLWLLLRSMDRTTVTWMQEWDRFPLFAAVGARPFPSDDPLRRAATVRATARRFMRDPRSGLVWFPEGRLHGSHEPLLAFDPGVPGRLHRLLGEPRWMAVGIRVVWGEESSPTAFLGGGPPTEAPDGREAERLRDAVRALPAEPHAPGRLLLGGRRGIAERLDLRSTRTFFERYL